MSRHTAPRRTGLSSGLLLLATLAASPAAAQSYYVFNGSSLTMVRDDPARVSPPEWAAFYYRKGATAGVMSQRWGIDTKKTAADVMRVVKANQDFERRYERWCKCDWGNDTFFNVIAPIAMPKPQESLLTPKQAQLLTRAHETWDQVAEWRDAYNNAADIAGQDQIPALATGPVAEFMQTMHDTIDRFMSLSEQISRVPDAALGSLDQSLAEFERSVARLRTTAEPALKIARDASSGGGAPGGTFRYTAADDPDQQVEQRLSVSASDVRVDRHTMKRPSGSSSFSRNWSSGRWTVARSQVAPSGTGPIPHPRGGGWFVRLACHNDALCVDAEQTDLYRNAAPERRMLAAAHVGFATEREAAAFFRAMSRPAAAPAAPAVPRAQAPVIAALGSAAARTAPAGGSRMPASSPATGSAPTAVKAPSAAPRKPDAVPAASAAKPKAAATSSRAAAATPKPPASSAKVPASSAKAPASPAKAPASSAKPPSRHGRTIVIGKSSLGYVNLRERPDTSSPIVGRVRAGEKYTATTSGGWYYIANKKGWVAGRYVTPQ